MKITVVSDLHLEFSSVTLTNTQGADVLILSGDIMIAEDLHDHQEPIVIHAFKGLEGLGRRQQNVIRFREFLRHVSAEYKDVIYVAGNHEFYNGKFFAGIKYLREECAAYPNIHFLENDTINIDGVTFVGGTLWTNLNKHDPLTLHAVRDMLNDFKVIRNDDKGYRPLSPADTAERHRNTLKYIKHIIDNVREKEETQPRVVVVGHHSPSFMSCSPQYANDYLMNGAYHSDLSEFILDHPEIALWTHGHTHHCFDYTIGETRIICNPRGYEADGHSEYTGWNPNIIIEI